MNTLSQIKITVLDYLQNGQIASAMEILNVQKNQQNQTAIHDAEILYLEAKVFLYQGLYLKALTPLQASLVHNPQQVTALCDLMLCYYQLGLTSNLKESLFHAHELLTEQALFLETQDVLDNAIFIAKLLEEMGDVEVAFEVLKIAHFKNLSPKQQQALHIQELRLACEIGDSKQVQNLYTLLTRGTQHGLNFEVEREHSLLLADSFLFGYTQALERYHYLMTLELTAPDRAFLSSEMAEHLILQNAFDKLSDLTLYKESESEYEKHQARLIESYLEKETHCNLSAIRLEKTLSPLSILRMIRQGLTLFPNSPEADSLKIRYRFLCSQLPSKKLQVQFSKFTPSTDTCRALVLNSETKLISISGKDISMKTALFWQLIPLFNDRNEVSLDEVIQAVYQEEPNTQHFDRLRMAVSRLNNSFKSSTDIEAIFKVSKTSVSLLVSAKEKVS